MLPHIRADWDGRLLPRYVRHAMLVLLGSVCKAQNPPVPGFGPLAAYQPPKTTVADRDASRNPSLAVLYQNRQTYNLRNAAATKFTSITQPARWRKNDL